MDCSPPGSSVHGISQARILEWVAFPPPGTLPNPGIESASLTSPELAGGFFTISNTLEALYTQNELYIEWNIIQCVRQTASGGLLCSAGSSALSSEMSWGPGGAAGSRKGGMCVYKAGWHYRTAESKATLQSDYTPTIKQEARHKRAWFCMILLIEETGRVVSFLETESSMVGAGGWEGGHGGSC